MNNYIDYEYYTNTFKGTSIPKDNFDTLATRASSKVRNAIFNRDISNFKSEVQNATCLVAEILYNQILNKERLQSLINGKNSQISSEKVGDYSINYANTSIGDLEKFTSNEYVDSQILDELYNCLFFTGLLYAGVPYVE